jgi:hypothetical protein
MNNILLYKTDNTIIGGFPHDVAETDHPAFKRASAVLSAIEKKINITNADLSNAIWHDNTVFDSVDFTGCDFSNAVLNGAKFKNCNFACAMFYKASLNGCVFIDCNLDGAIFHHTSLKNSDLGTIKLGLSDFHDTALVNCKCNGETIAVEPIFISGLDYPIVVVGDKISIGCETHTVSEWESYGTKETIKLDAKKAANFWNKWKEDIISISKKTPGYKTSANKPKKATT